MTTNSEAMPRSFSTPPKMKDIQTIQEQPSINTPSLRGATATSQSPSNSTTPQNLKHSTNSKEIATPLARNDEQSNSTITNKILQKRSAKTTKKPKLVCVLLKELKTWQETGQKPSEEAMDYFKFLNNKKS